jgi:hypothetical protein
MEWKRNTSNRLGSLALICLLSMLTACYDMNRNSSSLSSNTLTGVDGVVNNPDSGNSQLPPEETDNAAPDPSNPADPAPDDTASAEPEPVVIALRWQATSGQIDGYIVHTGPSPETATTVLTVTPDTTVEYDATTDLGLDVGDQSCFRIKAYNVEGQSGFSDAVCYTVNS